MLHNKVAVVTGASRGAGKGVALALGDAGATVYVTGRTSRHGPAVAAPMFGPTGGQAPGSVEDTADEVSRRGGRGIPVVCDHTDNAQVAALFERVVREQGGQLDLLVNAAWAGNELEIDTKPFWQLPVQDHWHNMFTAGVRAALTASHQAAAIMVAQGHQGLIINVTAWDDGKYTVNLMYDLAKASLNRMAYGMSQDLLQHKVVALAVAPGWMRTERVLAAFGCSSDAQHVYGTTSTITTSKSLPQTSQNPSSSATAPTTAEAPADPTSSTALRDAQPAAAEHPDSKSTCQPQLQTRPGGLKHWSDVPDLAVTESPLYLGRAVVALAADPEGARAAGQAGKVLRVADLAVQYGFTDVDGRQPPPFHW